MVSYLDITLWLVTGLTLGYLFVLMLAPSLNRKFRKLLAKPLMMLLQLCLSDFLIEQRKDGTISLEPFDRDPETGDLKVRSGDGEREYSPVNLRRWGRAKTGFAYEKVTPVFDVPFARFGEAQREKVADGGETVMLTARRQTQDGETIEQDIRASVVDVVIPESGVIADLKHITEVLSEGSGADQPKRVMKHAIASQAHHKSLFEKHPIIEVGAILAAFMLGAIVADMFGGGGGISMGVPI